MEKNDGKDRRKEKKIRCFIIYGVSSEYRDGLYHAKTPIQAALKAFNKLCYKMGEEEVEGLEFCIKEITRGSKRKVYYYRGDRRKLEEEKAIYKDGYIVFPSYYIRFNTHVKKSTTPHQRD